MKAFIVILLIAFVGFGIFSLVKDGDFDPSDIKNYPPNGQTVVAFGDSLVAGVGADTEGGFVTMLSQELGVPIENFGRGGDTTQNGLDRIDDVLNKNPDIVLILLGGNDFLKQVPREETFSNLSEIITTLQNEGAIVVVLGVRGGLLYDSYDEDFEELAKTHDTAYVSNVLENLLGESEFMDDAIHPNEKGYEIIAGRVSPVLGALLE